jgi:hypothetical protein
MKSTISFSLAALVLLVPNQPVQGAADTEEEKIIRLVQDSQRAGWEKHDYNKYMAIWADDARMVVGRSEKPGDWDFSYNRTQIASTRRLLFSGSPVKGFKMEFAKAQASVEGDKATLRYQTTMRRTEGVEIVNEIFHLRKKGGNWKVTENRVWPIEIRYGETIIRYDPQGWNDLDARVKKQQDASDLLNVFGALMDAFRFPEAHATAKKLSEQEKEQVSSWVVRGYAALFAGDADDSLASFRQALKLDPNAPLPDYARAALEKKK